MRRWRIAIGACLAALACAGAGSAAPATTPQELTVAMSDGTPLACALVEPDGTAPDGGWPALMLFHGLGGTHRDLEPAATGALASAGYASLMCDARGVGASGGLFGLDGPRDVQDTRELYAWLTSQPGISRTEIGAFGISLGGGAVWEAAAAGVPFRAIVPAIAWTNLLAALAPQGLAKSGLVASLAGLVPAGRWEPDLLAALGPLATGSDLAPVAALGRLTVPTLLIQGRHDFLFDLDQALTAYRRLRGPKALYLGDLGHAPSSVPGPDEAVYLGEALAWFDRYVKGDATAAKVPPVALAHDPWDGTATVYGGIPPTRQVSVVLPGTAALRGDGRAVRSVRLPGGPFETFGDTTIAVPYANASGWDRLVAVLAVAGSSTPISMGGVRLVGASGTATIRLLDEAVRIPRGARLTLTLGATSLVRSPVEGLYTAGVPQSGSIAIGRETLRLSVLRRTVSR